MNKVLVFLYSDSESYSYLAPLAKEELKDYRVINLLDDSMRDDMDLPANRQDVRKRFLSYLDLAKEKGAFGVISGSPILAEFAEEAKGLSTVNVFRLDEPSMKRVVRECEDGDIAIFSQYQPTLDIIAQCLRRRLLKAGKKNRVQEYLIPSQGDQEELLHNAIEDAEKTADCIYLLEPSLEAYARETDYCLYEEGTKELLKLFTKKRD